MVKCPDCGDVEPVKATATKRVTNKEETWKEEERTVCPECNQAL